MVHFEDDRTSPQFLGKYFRQGAPIGRMRVGDVRLEMSLQPFDQIQDTSVVRHVIGLAVPACIAVPPTHCHASDLFAGAPRIARGVQSLDGGHQPCD